MGFNPSTYHTQSYSVPQVVREVAKFNDLNLRVSNALELGTLQIKTPKRRAVERVIDVMYHLGEGEALSETDVNVAALALTLKEEGLNPILVSDDYSIQNLCEHLGLEYRSLSTLGITHKILWRLYCPACRRVYESGKSCPVCGTKLKRRAWRKAAI